MEEDECDYGTPIGKVIKRINILCKKPPIDNQLSNAIDLFHDKLNEQEKYLVNGIFKINFAESALFLQSCAELYGRKIDLLWNELLEFHTRLIKYDCEHQKEKGIPLNKEVIVKLEERRNRYLRKKKFKLLQETEVQAKAAEPPKPCKAEVEEDCSFLIDEDEKLFELNKECVFSKLEQDASVDKWEKVEFDTQKVLKIPYIVYVQMRRTYRLKNYPILRCQDFDILDMEDGEFNTKYSRIPGWHHIFHLMEYNDQGLLPDSNSAIAKIKLGVHGRIMFLKSRKLPFDTNLEDYKEEYMEFCNQFFKKEAKRWQNMPLNTMEDFRKQLQFLTKMCEENEENERYLLKGMGQYNIPGKIEMLDYSDEDSLFELTVDSDKNFVKSDLFVRLEKLSSEVVNTKLRQDSGYFDPNTSSVEQNAPVAEETENNPIEGVVTSSNINDEGNVENIATSENVTVTNKDNDDINKTSVSVNGEVPSAIGANNGDNFDTRSIISDHDYCQTPLPMDTSTDCDSNPVKNGQDKIVEDVFKKPLGVTRVIPKLVKCRELQKKRIHREEENDDLPPKRRKLSQKQIERLLKSTIIPVKLLKFEKFFSENYHPEEGEGTVPSVEYDPNVSDTEDADLHCTNDKNDQTQQEDIRSIHSDHSYCQPLPADTRNDSGFMEPLQPSNVNDQTDILSSFGLDFPFGEDLEALAAELRKQLNENNNAPEKQLVPWVPTEEDISELEREEARGRVEEWRKTITPILRNLKENDFDIHQYGSQIIEGMEINESKPFKDLVQGKTSAEVVRFFISSLQLANTNNIEICGAQQGQKSNDTYEIKLLSRDRYHEHLKEYLAPSEESLAEKLERVRAMSDRQENLGGSQTKTKHAKATDKTFKDKRSSCDSFNKKMMVKLTKLSNVSLSQRVTEETTASTCQHNKENRNIETPAFSNKAAKGKTIIKRQTTPHILNFDISLPSTSRHIHWYDQPQSSLTDPQMPSTSAQAASPGGPELSGTNQSDSPNSYRVSPNKRRGSDSTEETFAEQIAAAQRMNPDRQVHSTPHGPSPSKLIKFSSTSKKSILF